MANSSIYAAFERMWQHVVSVVGNKSDVDHSHDDKYYTESEIDVALEEVRGYADTAASNVKNDLLNGAGEAYDTLKELGELIDENVGAIEALETVATGKADKEHQHAISDVNNLQTYLDTKANKDYVDEQIAAIPTPDVSGQINDHNTDEEAHADIRAAIDALEGSGGSVQPDWAQNDETALDYVKNRPFYDTRNIIDKTITFDGNMDGKEAVNMGGSSYLVKVSDKIINSSDLIGETISVFAEGNIRTNEITDDAIFSQHPLYVINECVFICHEETAMNDTTTLTPGIWFMCINVDGISGVYVSSMSNQLVEGELKTIDPKYLPDGIGGGADWNQNDPNGAGYVENRTHWIEDEPKKVVLLPETSISPQFDDESMILSRELEKLTIGRTYFVTLNGVEYECVAREWESPNAVLIGNGTISNGDGNEGNGEPFRCESCDNGYLYFFANQAGDYTISISQVEYCEKIHHLDSKYIKDMYYEEGGEIETIIPEQTISGFSVVRDPIYAVQNPFEFNPVVGNKYTVLWDGVKYQCEFIVDSNTRMAYIGNANYLTMQGGGDIPFVIIFGGGIFLATESAAESHSIGVHIEEETIIHTIDTKYLPEHLQFGSKFELITVMEETDVPFSSSQYAYTYNNNAIAPVLGDKYIVSWDGVEYECELKDLNGLYIGLGNGIHGFYNGYESESQEPFCISMWNGGLEIFKEESIVTPVAVSIRKISENIVPIDAKYIPEHLQFGEEKFVYGSNVQLVNWIVKMTGNGDYMQGYVERNNVRFRMKEGVEYSVYVAPLSNTLVAKRCDEGLYLGNRSIYNSDYEDTGESFCIVEDEYGFYIYNTGNGDGGYSNVNISGDYYETEYLDPKCVSPVEGFDYISKLGVSRIDRFGNVLVCINFPKNFDNTVLEDQLLIADGAVYTYSGYDGNTHANIYSRICSNWNYETKLVEYGCDNISIVNNWNSESSVTRSYIPIEDINFKLGDYATVEYVDTSISAITPESISVYSKEEIDVKFNTANVFATATIS